MSHRFPLWRDNLLLSALAVILGAVAASPSQAAAQSVFRFEDVTTTHLPPAESVGRNSMDIGIADLDGDGDLDLIVPQEFLPNKLLLNDGSGRFTDAADRLASLSTEERAGGLNTPGHDSEDVVIADFDGDGVLDFIIVSEDDVRHGRTSVHEYYRGLGGAAFERRPGVLPDTEANAVAQADVNGDGFPDVLIVGAEQDRLLINDGRSGFSDETEGRLPAETVTGQDALFADIDEDGDLDIVIGYEGGHALWLNDGRGHFRDATAERLPDPGNVEARKVTAADVDGDGDLDLYFSHVGWQGRTPRDRLFINNGAGWFTDGTEGRLPVEAETTLDAVFADLDGDGDLDLVRGNANRVTVWFNDGTGVFTDVTDLVLPTQIRGPTLAVAVADFDGDGIPDLYVGQLAGAQPGAAVFDRLLLGRRTETSAPTE